MERRWRGRQTPSLLESPTWQLYRLHFPRSTTTASSTPRWAVSRIVMVLHPAFKPNPGPLSALVTTTQQDCYLGFGSSLLRPPQEHPIAEQNDDGAHDSANEAGFLI